jgi:ligand-binding sensor domain-containing protein/AraC-like DNA-binding protein
MNRLIFMVRLFALILGMGWSLPVLGLDPNTPLDKYIRHHWTTRDGLPQNTIHTIVQDSSGYLWLGTDWGLVRFDGSVFTVLRRESFPAIKNNSITALLIARDGALWIGTYGGGVTRYHRGTFRNYSLEEGLTNHFINAIAEDSQNCLWFGTTGDGVFRWKNHCFTSISDSDGLSYNIVTALFADSQGKLWVGTEKGLNCISNGRISVYTVHNGLPGDYINTVFEDRRGYLWVGTGNGAAFIRNRPLDLQEDRFISITSEVTLPDNHIRCITGDRDGNIWLATNGGLNRIKPGYPTNRRASPLNLAPEYPGPTDSLADDVLLSLYVDSWENLWVGTSGGGLYVLRSGEFEFYGEKDGLTSNYIKAIYEDREHTLWIGTGGGGLNRYEARTFTAYTTKDGLSSNDVESLCGDREGNLWIGTTNGLNRMSKGKFHVFTTGDGLSNQSIRSLWQDGKENLWIGTFGGGLNCYRDGQFTVYDSSTGLTDDFVLALQEDRYGNMWIGTNRGINCFDSHLFRDFNGREGVPRGRVLDIYSDPGGVLWIATDDDGLIRYKNGQFAVFKSSGEITDHVIYRILEDRQDNLWLSSSGGIFSVSKRRLNWVLDKQGRLIDWRHFREGDGLKTSVCSGGFQPAGCMTSAGRIWFPTMKGIAVMDLGKPRFTIKFNPEIPDLPREPEAETTELQSVPYLTVARPLAVFIDKIVADGISYTSGSSLRLPTGTKRIEFFFKVINWRAPENVVFRYRLLGHDQYWIRSSFRRSVSYLDLGAGKYEFVVKARFGDSNWSYIGDSCFFSIKPPFSQTFWFYLLLVSAITLGLWGGPRLWELMAHRRETREEKYRGSALTVPKSKAYLRRVLKIMAEEKPYLDPELSLQKLAQRVGITKEDLSQVINEHLGRNFKNFINKYRIEDACKKLLDPKENQFVLLKIAFDVGFNSKSVFNASFKKFTGLSPSQYRNRHQNRESRGEKEGVHGIDSGS